MASQIGFEPTAFRLGGEPSIQLRYWDKWKNMKFSQEKEQEASDNYEACALSNWATETGIKNGVICVK